MSDFNSSLPIRTENNGDVISKICDGTTSSYLLGVDSQGNLSVKLKDGYGNALDSTHVGGKYALDIMIIEPVAGAAIDPRDTRALTAADIVTAAQGAPNTSANAWPVLITDGTNDISLTAAGEVKVSVTQPLPAGTNVIGSVNQGTSPWITKDQSDGPVTAGAVASFSSLIGGQYNSTLPTLTTGQQAAVQVDSSGRLLVTLAAFSGLLAEDHDYGAVGANTLRTAAQIGNASGAADFNAGATGAQTLRVVANQGAPNTLANGWYVRPSDGTNAQAYTAAGEAEVTLTTAIPAGANNIGIVESNTRDGAGTAITSGAQGAKQALDVELNANGALVSNANPLPVFMSNAVPGTEILDFKQATAIAGAASDTHTYTVTALKTATLQQICASGSGKIKVEISINSVLKIVLFNSTAQPNVNYIFANPQQVAAGVAIDVVLTNLDKSAQNLYSTIELVEV